MLKVAARSITKSAGSRCGTLLSQTLPSNYVASEAVRRVFKAFPVLQRHITRKATEELKIDGFRALAHVHNGQGELVSRNGNAFRGFAELANWIAARLKVESAVLDGEICCLDEDGRPNFRDLLFRRRECIFIAFDLLYLNGRKRARMFYLDHVESDGCLLFEQVLKMDLEGIVCKRKDSPYKATERPSRYWIKVKNARYSQLEGREELFERA
jgi:ATP-dependent DNA ligase